MVAYKGSEKLKEIHIGSTKIIEIYKGSTLLYSSGSYPSGTVLFENATAGTYTLQVDYNCTVHLDLVGGGGGSAGIKIGGSGAYISGNMNLTAGSYTIIIGAKGKRLTASSTDGENSNFMSNIAGYGHKSTTTSNGAGGTATIVTTGLTGQNGNSGDTTGWINGYGAGGKNSDGTDGYCKIVVV